MPRDRFRNRSHLRVASRNGRLRGEEDVGCIAEADIVVTATEPRHCHGRPLRGHEGQDHCVQHRTL